MCVRVACTCIRDRCTCEIPCEIPKYGSDITEIGLKLGKLVEDGPRFT